MPSFYQSESGRSHVKETLHAESLALDEMLTEIGLEETMPLPSDKSE